ncbi:MAG: hypothetical protein MI748_00985 [Opitutales bacterium]|nr:hypothetical protein [Opitutales bacterium]
MKRFLIILSLFISINAHAKVHDEQLRFKEIISDADEVRIRTGGECHRDKINEVYLLESKSGRDIFTVAGTFQFKIVPIDLSKLDVSCLCCGTHTVEFYSKKEKIISFSIHHDSHIRCKSLNSGRDIHLTQESINAWKNLCETITKEF